MPTKRERLEAIGAAIVADGICPELAESATQLVLGDGNPDAEVVLIGEAPGAQEDRQGKPFVGASGKFLNEMLATIGMTREDVYITNIVKYRPPGNRDPLPQEVQAFVPYLRDQLTVISPLLIVFLGRHAMNVFLPELKISQAHGQPKRKDGQVYLPLYHPAAALYNGGMRQQLMDDFSVIPTVLQQIKSKPQPA